MKNMNGCGFVMRVIKHCHSRFGNRRFPTQGKEILSSEMPTQNKATYFFFNIEMMYATRQQKITIKTT
jgi:hypothetical protein